MITSLSISQKKLLIAGGIGAALYWQRAGSLAAAGGAVVTYFLLEQAWPEHVSGARELAKTRGASDEAVHVDSKGFWGEGTWVGGHGGGGPIDHQIAY